jgi:hypothetical protein
MQNAPIEKLGTGIWFMLHFMGKNATTPQLKSAYRENIKKLAIEFPCEKCRPHFSKFVDENPLILFDHILNEKGEDIGYFKWSVLCHNKVNAFLKKYTPSFEEAYIFFYGIGFTECNECKPPNIPVAPEQDIPNSKSETSPINKFLIPINRKIPISKINLISKKG